MRQRPQSNDAPQNISTSNISRPPHRDTIKPTSTSGVNSNVEPACTPAAALQESGETVYSRGARFGGLYTDTNISSELPQILQRMYEGSYKPVHQTVESALEFILPADQLKTLLSGCLYNSPAAKAIYLYTVEHYFQYQSTVYYGLYSLCNTALMEKKVDLLVKLSDYLYYLLTGIQQCPKVRNKTVWRGMALPTDAFGNHSHFTSITWLGVNSCSKSEATANEFSLSGSINPFVMSSDTIVDDLSATKHILCRIDVREAYDVSDFSAFPYEQEVILLPGSRLTVFEETHSAGVSIIKMAQENMLPDIRIEPGTPPIKGTSSLSWKQVVFVVICGVCLLIVGRILAYI